MLHAGMGHMALPCCHKKNIQLSPANPFANSNNNNDDNNNNNLNNNNNNNNNNNSNNKCFGNIPPVSVLNIL